MIKITNTTNTGNINIVGLSISTEDNKNTIDLKMVGDKEKILEMIVNTVNDGLADKSTYNVTKNFMNILFNSVIGICQEQDDFVTKRLVNELQRVIENK